MANLFDLDPRVKPEDDNKKKSLRTTIKKEPKDDNIASILPPSKSSPVDGEDL